MPVLSLDPQEARVLRQTLETALGSLRFEIAHTDTREFREILHSRARTLEHLIEGVARIESSETSPFID